MTGINGEEAGAGTSLRLRPCLDERAAITAEADFIGHIGKMPVVSRETTVPIAALQQNRLCRTIGVDRKRWRNLSVHVG